MKQVYRRCYQMMILTGLDTLYLGNICSCTGFPGVNSPNGDNAESNPLPPSTLGIWFPRAIWLLHELLVCISCKLSLSLGTLFVVCIVFVLYSWVSVIWIDRLLLRKNIFTESFCCAFLTNNATILRPCVFRSFPICHILSIEILKIKPKRLLNLCRLGIGAISYKLDPQSSH